EGRVRLGSGPAYTSEIEDPDGRYARLVRLLDGTRTISDLLLHLQGTFDRSALTDALRVMFDEGFLEDGADVPPPNLTPEDVQRYAPNINFFRTMVAPGKSPYLPQAELKETRVTLLGLGGIGSNVCVALAELGVGHITAVDFDRIELSNLNRQVLYSTD